MTEATCEVAVKCFDAASVMSYFQVMGEATCVKLLLYVIMMLPQFI